MCCVTCPLPLDRLALATPLRHVRLALCARARVRVQSSRRRPLRAFCGPRNGVVHSCWRRPPACGLYFIIRVSAFVPPPVIVARGLSSGGQMLPHSISSSPRILISSHSIFFPVSLPFPPPPFPFLSFHSIPFHPPPPPICHVYVLHLVSDLNYLYGGRNDRRHSLFILAAFLCSSFMFLLLSRFCAVCTVAVLTCKSLFSRAYASDVIDGRVNVKRAQ